MLDGIVASLTGKPAFLRHLDLSAGLLRRRRNPQGLFIGWLLKGDWDDGTARVHGLIQHRYFRRIGINSVLLRAPRRSGAHLTLRQSDLQRIVDARFDVTVFGGVHGPGAQKLARALRDAGTRTIFVTGDLVGGDMAGNVDWIVGASEGLTSIAGTYRDRSSVIESVLECPSDQMKDYSRPSRNERIRVVWVGYPENLHLLRPVRAALADPRLSRFDLVTISRGPGVTHQWHRKGVWSQLLACDIAVLPSAETEWYQAKPNTRMVMFKALGIPIVASPLASYVATLNHGRSCYFARTPEEWASALLALSGRVHRAEIGLAERERILAKYRIEANGQEWLGLFRRLSEGRTAACR
jgi:glycosyltransferase involved in cell wall biosynthesis